MKIEIVGVVHLLTIYKNGKPLLREVYTVEDEAIRERNTINKIGILCKTEVTADVESLNLYN